MKYIYLAGAMEAYDGTNEAREWRNKVKEYFSSYLYDFECISPVDYYEYGSDICKNNHEVMRFDLRKVRESDIILVNLKDIRKSLGTSDEILYAFISKKPIIGFIEDDTIQNVRDYVHSWKYEQVDRIEVGDNALEKACEYIMDYYG